MEIEVAPAMTFPTRYRSRILTILLTLGVAAFFCLIFARQIASVHAAKLIMLGGSARPIAELASNPAADPGPTPTSAPTSAPNPVLVELFTSEGCSSCPPADALLAQLSLHQPVPQASIIVLEEHVDYWNSLGWKDRFSSPQLTARQSAYVQQLHLDDNYTPQMIVDGTEQFVGNDSSHALKAIAHAAQVPKLALSLSPPTLGGGYLMATASLAEPTAPSPDAEVFAALVEPMASTQVLNGENGGRTLQHVSVVRALKRVGSLSDLSSAPLKLCLEAPKDANPGDLRIVAFIQRSGQGPIIGATLTTAPANAPATTSIAATH